MIYRTALHLLSKEIMTDRKFRLVGIGLTKFSGTVEADPPHILDFDL